MGLFDIFRKKRKITVLDKANEIMERYSKNTDTPLMCYKTAYVTLPQELYQNAQTTLNRISTRPESAGFLFYTKACITSGCTPRRAEASEFFTHIGQLTAGKTYYIIQYPSPQPLRLDAGIPVFAPYFSSVIVDETSGEFSYFVLGQMLKGGTSLRTVNANGANISLGYGSEPTLDAFLQLLRSEV